MASDIEKSASRWATIARSCASFKVFHKLVVGRGDEVGEGIAGLGVAAEQGAGGLTQQGFAELRIAPGAGLDGCIETSRGRHAARFLLRPCECVGVGQSAVAAPAGCCAEAVD